MRSKITAEEVWWPGLPLPWFHFWSYLIQGRYSYYDCYYCRKTETRNTCTDCERAHTRGTYCTTNMSLASKENCLSNLAAMAWCLDALWRAAAKRVTCYTLHTRSATHAPSMATTHRLHVTMSSHTWLAFTTQHLAVTYVSTYVAPQASTYIATNDLHTTCPVSYTCTNTYTRIHTP